MASTARTLGLGQSLNSTHRSGARDATTSRTLPIAVPGIAVVVAVIASVLSLRNGWATLYNDAQAHLDIARRVTDGLTPGLAQLGSVWLPLPQVLMAPLTWFAALWHSGVAGGVISGAAFVYAAMRIFSLAEEVTGKRLAGWAAFAVWMCNLNLLYMQTTPLDEILMLAFMVGSVYHLMRWTRTFGLSELALAGAFTFMATLTRYEGWALFVAELAVVVVWTRLHKRDRRIVQANFLFFAAIGAYGIVLWLLYNLVIFHDPLYFLHSTYSAQSQQLYLSQIGVLPTKGHLGTTVSTLGWAITDVAGPAAVIAAVIGVAVLLTRRHTTLRRNAALVAILLAPVLLNVFTLLVGQTTIRVPQAPPFQLFNTRYGLEAMPLIAVAAGALAGVARRWVTAVPFVAAASVVVTMAVTTPVTLAEGQHGTSRDEAAQADAAASYIKAHYTGGGILTDDGASSPLIFRTGFDLKQFVTVDFHPYYEEALANPSKAVRWVIVYRLDALDGQIQAHRGRYSAFVRVFHEDPITVYELPAPGSAVALTAR